MTLAYQGSTSTVVTTDFATTKTADVMTLRHFASTVTSAQTYYRSWVEEDSLVADFQEDCPAVAVRHYLASASARLMAPQRVVCQYLSLVFQEARTAPRALSAEISSTYSAVAEAVIPSTYVEVASPSREYSSSQKRKGVLSLPLFFAYLRGNGTGAEGSPSFFKALFA